MPFEMTMDTPDSSEIMKQFPQQTIHIIKVTANKINLII